VEPHQPLVNRKSARKSSTRVRDALPTQHGRLRPVWWLVLIVISSSWLLYLPALDAGWTDTDDLQLIVEDSRFLTNSPLSGAFERPFFPAAASSKHYYRPLVTLSFMIDARRTGAIVPGPFHATNVALHVLTCLLLLAIAGHATGNAMVAAAVALVFAVHPSAVQTVTWVPGRSDGLLAVFALGSILAWLRYDRLGSRTALGFHAALLAASLLCKETAVALVPLVLSYSLCVTRQIGRLRDVRPWISWMGALGIWLSLRWSHAEGAGIKLDPALILKNTPMLVTGFGKLTMLVDLQVLSTLQDTQWWPGWVALVLVASGALWLRCEGRRLYLWAAFAIPLLVLAPTLAVSDVLILDNRLYLANAGLVLGLGVLGEHVLRAKPDWKGPLSASLAVLLVLLGAATVRHSRAFESPKAFCRAAVAGSPHLALAHVNLGSAYFREGDLDAAARQFARAIELDARWPVAHNNLGLVFLNQGQVQKAEQEFATELAVNPDYPKAHFNLGLVLASTDRAQEARAHFERVVQLVPSDVSAWGELLKYWGPRDGQKAAEIIAIMERLGVRFHSPQRPR
jgi:hypothetical protein